VSLPAGAGRWRFCRPTEPRPGTEPWGDRIISGHKRERATRPEAMSNRAADVRPRSFLDPRYALSRTLGPAVTNPRMSALTTRRENDTLTFDSDPLTVLHHFPVPPSPQHDDVVLLPPSRPSPSGVGPHGPSLDLGCRPASKCSHGRNRKIPALHMKSGPFQRVQLTNRCPYQPRSVD